MADEKKEPDSVGLLPTVCCPACLGQMSWVVDRSRMALSRTNISCKNDGCQQRGIEYKVPAVVMERA